jgi:SAM-dependent methyltransferase
MTLRKRIKRTLPPVRQGTGQWIRAVMNADLDRELRQLRPETSSVVEFAGANWDHLPWRDHVVLDIPEFDLCAPPHSFDQYDVVLCEQVLEHVVNPLVAVDTLKRLCRPGGHIFVGTPFLVRLHDHPGDYWRFTPDGMRVLLESQGLQPQWIRSWGNRKAIVASFDHWEQQRPWKSLKNEPHLPAVVWAMARP